MLENKALRCGHLCRVALLCLSALAPLPIQAQSAGLSDASGPSFGAHDLLASASGIPHASGAAALSRASVSVNANVDEGAKWGTYRQTLHNTGVTQAVVLGSVGQSREFFLPVPRGVPVRDLALSFRARYLLGQSSGGTLQLMLDDEPVFARTYTGERGDIDVSLPLTVLRAESGFVRLRVNWLSNQTLRTCEIEPPSSNSLTILPDTGLTFSMAGDGRLDLVSAWHRVPAKGVLTLSGQRADAAAFDSAWRIGAALDLAGKRMRFKALPERGGQLVWRAPLPEVLNGQARLAGLKVGQSVALDDEAHFAMALLLDPQALLGDVAVMGSALQARIEVALKALDALAMSPSQQAWLDRQALRSGVADLLTGDDDAFVLGAGPSQVLVIRAGSGERVAGVFSSLWRNILTTSGVRVTQARAQPLGHEGSVRLGNLGAQTSSVNVVNHSVWQADFPYSSLDFEGRVPDELVLDMAVSPDTSGARPVVSVTWNDILLAAVRLQADGKPERLTARVPAYAVGQSNSIKVSLQRLPSASGCTEPQVGFAFNVLPTSYFTTHVPVTEPSFVGVMPLLADKATLVLPASWLNDASHALSHVVRLAAASGLSPMHTTLQLHDDTPYEATGPFVAMDVEVKGVTPKLRIAEGGQVILSGQPVATLDVSGLADLSAVEVVQADRAMGLHWLHPPKLDDSQTHDDMAFVMPYDLDRGDVAIVAPSGLVSWLDSTDPDAATLTERVSSAFHEWRRFFSWGAPMVLGLLLLVIVLLALAYRAGRRNGVN